MHSDRVIRFTQGACRKAGRAVAQVWAVRPAAILAADYPSQIQRQGLPLAAQVGNLCYATAVPAAAFVHSDRVNRITASTRLQSPMKAMWFPAAERLARKEFRRFPNRIPPSSACPSRLGVPGRPRTEENMPIRLPDKGRRRKNSENSPALQCWGRCH